ncbi:hypothetical protein B0T25DRAFT_497110 [Lasiosphaeria hispida]|uniref:Rhodopsin domain-containing protein n=1 Tax=Lasiosphaeria hispida TaxID=260671 RepID=A0AAJ0HKM4_9PEZI|nr:hypothetical protein B0T25DRAFT_497110 [Lasiosphaeria hispida]
MADTSSAAPVLPPPPPPRTGPGPLGVLGGSDRSYQVDIIVCAVVTAIIGCVFVALRFYTRRVIIYVLGWEDWLILAAQIFSIAMCAGFIHEVALGHGKHVWLIPVENISPMAKAGWYTILFYELSLFCSQVSIMLLYIRIWTIPWVRRTAHVLLALVLVYNTLVVAMVATACVPLSAFWDFTIQANTYLHVIVDFMIYLLPMPVILRVRFPRRQKALLLVLFAFGFFVCAISIIRLYILKITADTLDYTFDNIPIAIWSCLETNATVVIACFMTMKPLLSKFFPNVTNPGGEGDEQYQQDAMADSTGRVPTIGSRPSRMILIEQHESWMFTGEGGEAEEKPGKAHSPDLRD